MLPQEKHPDGDGPQSREPQSLAIGGCEQAPLEQMSCVQLFPSAEHATLPTTGTHVEPLNIWHSGQERTTHAPATHSVPVGHGSPQVKHPDSDRPHRKEPQSFVIEGCVHIPSTQMSRVHATVSSAQARPLDIGTHREPSRNWQGGHGVVSQTPASVQ